MQSTELNIEFDPGKAKKLFNILVKQNATKMC